jgi:AI-2 transport protein TqsA
LSDGSRPAGGGGTGGGGGRALLGLASAVVAVAGLKAFAALAGPVFLALVLTIAFRPVAGWFAGRGAPAWAGAVAAILTAYAVLIGVGAALALSVARLAGLLPAYRDRLAALRDGLRGWLEQAGVAPDQADAVAGQGDPGHLARLLGDLVGGLAGAVTQALFVLALLLFMGLDARWFPAALRASAQARPEIAAALAAFARGTRRYLVVTTVFGLIVAAVDTLALWPLGVPAPLVWGLLSFITNYIPNIGFVLGLVPPALLGLLEGGPGLMVTVVAVYCVANFVIQSIIQPKFVGDAVGLSATLTLLSLVFWTWVIGPVGALLAVPLTLLAKALLVDGDPGARGLRPLLAGPDRPGGR